MKKSKKAVALLLSIALMVGLIPATVYAAIDPSVSINIAEMGASPGVYEMTVTATAPSAVKQFEVVLSYDNTQIQAVKRTDKSVILIQDGDNQDSNTDLGSHTTNLITYDENEDPDLIYTKAIAAYIDDTQNRTAIYYVYANSTGFAPNGTVMFKAYFKPVGAVTEDDFNVLTFKVETDQNGFLARCLADGDRYGVRMGYSLTEFVNYDGDNDPLTLSFVYPNSDQLITPTVYTWPTPSAITYDQGLEESDLIGGTASVPGYFDWDGLTVPTVADSDTTPYPVKFFPNDSEFYNTVSGTLTVTVNPMQVPVPAVWGNSTYTGLSQTPNIPTDDNYTVTGSAIDAGTYNNAVVSLTDPANCEWEGGGTGDKTFSWTIDPANYTVDVLTKQIKVGSADSELPAASTTGVNGETPAGILTWYASEAARTAGTPMDDGYVGELTLGDADANKDYTLYWRFQQTADDNYIKTIKEGSTVITIINGDPQFVEITGEPVADIYYGAPNFSLGSVVTTTGGVPAAGHGTVTWSSSDITVAGIDPNTGAVEIRVPGSTTITASAAAVPGSYAAGSSTWVLEVLQVPLTVTAGTYTVTKVYDSTVEPGTGSGDISVTGVLAGDAGLVTVTPYPRSYTSEDVGGQASVLADLVIYGIQSQNYTLNNDTVSVPCSITQKPITGVSVTSVTKTYDGSIGPGNAVINGTPTLAGMVEGDDLTISLTIGAFSNPNVATAGKTASVMLGAFSGVLTSLKLLILANIVRSSFPRRRESSFFI